MIYILFAAGLIGGTSEEELKKKVKEEQERVAGFWTSLGRFPFTPLAAIIGICCTGMAVHFLRHHTPGIPKEDRKHED
jgi:hypothetical protein